MLVLNLHTNKFTQYVIRCKTKTYKGIVFSLEPAEFQRTKSKIAKIMPNYYIKKIIQREIKGQ